ncbi:hypothetical protein FAZ69_07660 [Trinickia terrae]|uniref:DUF4156 domain-containing protein n=1 Tax=Trinickia terrae TaxID=2571161 RepID=A0A4U1IC83_9BURK|nr:hypothetical protein [Trinickia terrae]TKC91222.1 hypothetical protein FAZ69_07660 [Trinickia terrae]
MPGYVKLSLAVCAAALLGACASGPVITPTGQANTYMITAQAQGGSLAWGRAWNQANDRADAFCKERGLRASTRTTSTSGIGAIETHETTLVFTCHPDWETAGKN